MAGRRTSHWAPIIPSITFTWPSYTQGKSEEIWNDGAAGKETAAIERSFSKSEIVYVRLLHFESSYSLRSLLNIGKIQTTMSRTTLQRSNVTQLSRQKEMLAVNIPSNYDTTHLHLYVSHKADLSTKRVISHSRYVFITWHTIQWVEGMVAELHVRWLLSQWPQFKTVFQCS